MPIPDILALDFDGVLCDGMQEYFETSRRTYAQVWPDAPTPGEELFPAFQTLRPVIMTGWEMPVLLRALTQGHTQEAMLADWEAVRDTLVQPQSPEGKTLGRTLSQGLDDVRRDWIASSVTDWLTRNVPYCSMAEMQRLVAEPEAVVLVTTKEGEFARQILDDWGLHLADIQGKEAGTHKCDNLRALIAQHTASHGRRPRLWFVEDRLETLQHVASHDDLNDVGLFLADWGYNTAATRATVAGQARIRLLSLAQFRGGVSAWPA